LLVESDARTASLISAVLEARGLGPVEVVRTVAGAREWARAFVASQVIVALDLPGGDALQLIDVFRRSAATSAILILTSAKDERGVLRALRAGADGCLFKEELGARLAGASEGSGEAASRGAASRKGQGGERSAPVLPSITPRESSVLDLLATGGGYAEIADELAIAINTVRTHVRSLYDKLGVENRAEAVNLAWNLGLLRRGA
jgi:DNA-binding NarL/FixJ family response regulator